MTMLLIGKQDGSGIKSSKETCRILRLRRLHHGRIPLGNGIPGGGLLQNLTKHACSFGLSGFGLPERSTDKFDVECTQHADPQRA